MRKEEADAIKSDFDRPIDRDQVLVHMEEEELNDSICLLDFFSTLFEEGIADYSLDFTHDLLDDEDGEIVRVFWFSKGMTENYICFNGLGQLRHADKDIPMSLLSQITQIIKEISEE